MKLKTILIALIIALVLYLIWAMWDKSRPTPSKLNFLADSGKDSGTKIQFTV